MDKDQHAALGASSADRWMNCAGSVALVATVPPTTSIYAQEGTAAHTLASRALEKDLDPEVWLGSTIDGFDVDDDMVTHVRVFTEYVRRCLKETLNGKLWIETQFDLSALNPPGPMYGTADAAIYAPASQAQVIVRKGQRVTQMARAAKLEVIDLKYGVGVIVEVTENPQLMYYALGAVLDRDVKVDEVTVTVVQPRALHRDGIVRSYVFGWQELLDFKKELFARARATQDPNAPLVVGHYCRFCPALAVCPAQKEMALAVAQEEFSAIQADDLAPPEALTLAEITEVMEKAPIIEKWFAAVKEFVRARTEEGQDTGYKLIPKRANRKWHDADEAEAWLVRHLGEEAYVRKVRSVAQAEKALRPLGVAIDPSQWHQTPSGTNLVPNSDPREAIAPRIAAEDDFEARP